MDDGHAWISNRTSPPHHFKVPYQIWLGGKSEKISPNRHVHSLRKIIIYCLPISTTFMTSEWRWEKMKRKRLVWFICLMTYQLPVGYMIPKFDSFVNVSLPSNNIFIVSLQFLITLLFAWIMFAQVFLSNRNYLRTCSWRGCRIRYLQLRRGLRATLNKCLTLN